MICLSYGKAKVNGQNCIEIQNISVNCQCKCNKGGCIYFDKQESCIYFGE